MAVIFLESGGSGPGGATGLITATPQTGAIYNGATSGSVVPDTGVKEHGYSSLKHDSAASASAYVARLACLADAGRRISVRMRFAGLPASNTGIIRALTSGAATNWEVRLDSAGKLRLYAGASGTTLVVTGATTLTTNTWYRISVAYTITSAGVNQFRVYLNGTIELTASNVASSVTATSMLRIGWTGTTPGVNIFMYSQDLYVDDSSALTDTGNVRVTAKKPAALGATNDFDTLVGTGTNRWDRVSERPINTSNGMTHGGTGLVREQFTVEAAAVGDDNLTGATILDWAGWTYFAVVAAAGSTASKPVVNGVDKAYTTVAGSGVYQATYNLAASTSYPSSNTAIGQTSTTSAVDTLLRECGVMIAYIAAGAATRYRTVMMVG
jgi:hypothetical protein